MVMKSGIAKHCKISQFQLLLPNLSLLLPFVLFDEVGVSNPNFKIDGIGDRVVRFPHFIGRVLSTTVYFTPGLSFELFVVSFLLLSSAGSFHLFCLSGVDLVACHLGLIVKFLVSFPRLPSLLFFYLVLKVTSQHILLFVDSVDPVFLFLGYSLLELLNLFLFELVALVLALAVADGCFVAVNVVQSVLVRHELVVVLFVD